jgi:hypothetical protein
MRDSRAVAAIVGALRKVHGDDTARLMLQDGMTLEALIDGLLRAPLSDRASARLMGAALESGDFVITPDFTTCVSHLKFIYDAPGSFRVRDIVMLTEQGAFRALKLGCGYGLDPRSQKPRPFVTTNAPRGRSAAHFRSTPTSRRFHSPSHFALGPTSGLMHRNKRRFNDLVSTRDRPGDQRSPWEPPGPAAVVAHRGPHPWTRSRVPMVRMPLQRAEFLR